MPSEEEIKRYERFREQVRDIVDMPDRMLNQMLNFIHAGNGNLPKDARMKFDLITDEEIERMEKSYRNLYRLC